MAASKVVGVRRMRPSSARRTGRCSFGIIAAMGTEKRERQRANRDERRAAEAKIQQRQAMLNNIKRAVYFVIIIAIVLVAAAAVF